MTLCMVAPMTRNENEGTLDATNRLMGALVCMEPKPHEEMKVGKNAKKHLAEAGLTLSS